MNKPDFKAAAKDYITNEYILNDNVDTLPSCSDTFVAGCEHAYSILEKENADKDKRIHDLTYALKTIKFDLNEGKLYQDTKFFLHLINQALKS